MAHIIRMSNDNVVKKVLQFKVTGIRKRGRPRQMGRLSGIWDYKRENLENKSKQEVIMEESSKEGTGP
ncbi:hypothetical protein TNCV_4174201 [Trichonephila clavipes]|nr:hypothetical protein TNCV_4174201 [Trichonephila clavipes]